MQKKMLLFFYSVLCKPCKWCAIKTIYKQKDVQTYILNYSRTIVLQGNIISLSVLFVFSVVEFQNWNISGKLNKIQKDTRHQRTISLLCDFSNSQFHEFFIFYIQSFFDFRDFWFNAVYNSILFSSLLVLLFKHKPLHQ